MLETEIPAPVNPLTKKINLTILRFVGGNFASKWLPAYDRVITSDLRTAEHNKAVGGAENSAHVHGLAEDFQLKFRANGQAVPQAQAKAIYEQFIAPNWPGFTEFESASAGEGYHIHWQLSREISTYVGAAGVAALGVVGVVMINNWRGSHG